MNGSMFVTESVLGKEKVQPGKIYLNGSCENSSSTGGIYTCYNLSEQVLVLKSVFHFQVKVYLIIFHLTGTRDSTKLKKRV